MEPDLCPPWWPRLIWDLHRPWKFPGGGGGPGGPVNYPPAIDDIMATLSIHTFSYLLLDQGQAQEFRNMAERHLADTAGQLSKLHNAQRGTEQSTG